MTNPLTLGIELDEGLARAVLVDQGGKVVARAEEAQHESSEIAVRAARSVLAAAKIAQPIAVGVAAVESEDRASRSIVDALAAELKTRTSVPILDVGQACVLAEAWCGAGQGARHVVAFLVGTRVTAGIVSDGALLKGARGLAGSVAWLALNPVEREDYRRLGCLEAEAGAAGIVRRLVWRIKSGDRSRVLEMVDGDFSAIRIGHVLTGAREGDGVAISVVRDTVKYLGMAISNIAAIVDPELVVLRGIVQSASDLLLDPIRQECARRMAPAVFARLRIELSTLGEDAAALGAARHAMISGHDRPVGS